MKIEIIKSVVDADKAIGLSVVLDVFRAFSVEAYIFGNGAYKIIPVRTLEEAYALKKENSEYILVGERGGVKPEGFDYGNSPTEILDVDFSGKTIVHTTSNGTKGLLNSINAEVVLAGSFLIADSIVKYIKQNNIENIFLISTDTDTKVDNEDIILAYYIRDALEGKTTSESEIRKMMTQTPAYNYLFNTVGIPATDFDLCLDFHKFNFIIKKVISDGQIYLIREDI